MKWIKFEIMTDVEKLARDICWAGFNFPPKIGKVRYWAEIASGARESYLKTAEEFLWIASRIDQKAFEMIKKKRRGFATEEEAGRLAEAVGTMKTGEKV